MVELKALSSKSGRAIATF